MLFANKIKMGKSIGIKYLIHLELYKNFGKENFIILFPSQQ
jgi:hypothetical protein